jgi:flagellum-specific ATP synthase
MAGARRLVSTVATYRRSEDLINIGAYEKGSSRDIDLAIDMIDRINAFLRQDIDERVDFEQCVQGLASLSAPS